MSSKVFHRAQSWVRCFFLLILMTRQTHSDPQMQDCLLRSAYSTAQSMGPKTTTLLQEDLAALEEWERLWQMSFNPSLYRCSVLHVTAGRRNKVYHSSYRVNDQELMVADSSKYHGMKVTSDLTWSSHIADVAGNANRSLEFLRRNFKQCTNEVKQQPIPRWPDQS